MEVVIAFVGGDADGFAVEGEGSVADAVGVAAHNAAQEAGALGVACGIITAQNHIGHIATGIGDQQAYQSGAVVCDGSGDMAVGDGVQGGGFAGGDCTERSFHCQILLPFFQGKRQAFAGVGFVHYTIHNGGFQLFFRSGQEQREDFWGIG